MVRGKHVQCVSMLGCFFLVDYDFRTYCLHAAESKDQITVFSVGLQFSIIENIGLHQGVL